MGVKLGKDSIDLGIVVPDGPKALAFYRDTLGFDHIATTPMPGGGGTMERLMCGTSLIKVVVPGKELAPAVPGGIQGAFGYRYWTITISNLDDVLGACEKGGYKVVVGRREVRPGVSIGIVEDPFGNWVEFLEQS